MSEFYFCVFCDTIVLSLDLLRDHLSQHFAEEGNEDQLCLSDTERLFVNNFIEYEKDLSESMSLMPKELPKDNVKVLLIGCPACDSLIRCFDLIPERKEICNCGEPLGNDPLFHCIQCNRLKHLKCILKSGNGECLDCQSKNFEISYLKCLTFEEQRDHCYQHLAYYPFVCQYKTGDQICGRKLITYNSCEEHLLLYHKYCLNDNKDIFDVLSSHFDYNPIDKIDDLINNRLNSKSTINTTPLSIETSPPNRCLLPNDCQSISGLSVGHRLEFIDNSDDEFCRSFHYTSEELAKKYRKYNRLEAIPDHNYMRNDSMDDSYTHSLEYIPLPDIDFPKKRGRPKGSKNKQICTQSVNTPEAEDNAVPEEVVDLTHRSQYLNWFTQTKATKFPYFPQKDDEVYYLPYGHELYKQEVMKRGLYNQSNRNYTMRFFNYDKIPAKVAKIDFLFKERKKTETVIRCIYITLRPYDEKYGTIIHVKYHDMEGVLDFIILKEHYETSVQKEWQIGEHFRSIIDDKFWFGVVVGYNNAAYSHNSLFKRYQIKWLSNKAIDYLSPWDLEPIDPNMDLNLNSSVAITEEDRRLFFIRHREEWPDYNEGKELRRIVRGLKIIYNMDKTKQFPILQDLTDSQYREKILYPVDLKTFIARIENRFYRRHLAIKYDIKFMEANIRKLIKSVKRDPEYRLEETIAKRLKYHTKFVTALCLLFIDTHECKNPYDLYPNIDDYLETHDVKCYSAKRVHLNMKKKYPNCLPAPHKRLPKRPQSFGDSAKTLKIFKALSNTETLNRRYSQPEATTSSTPKQKKILTKKASPKSAPHIMHTYVPIRPTNEEIGAQSTDEEEVSKNMDYCSSSDVSRSEFEYPVVENPRECSDDSDVDPDFQTTKYYKRHIY